MDSKPEIEVIRRVHFDEHYIEVGEYPDAPVFVELRTAGAANVEYFGSLNLSLPPAAARQLGLALIATAGDIEAKK